MNQPLDSTLETPRTCPKIGVHLSQGADEVVYARKTSNGQRSVLSRQSWMQA